MERRRFLIAPLALVAWRAQADVAYPAVTPGRALAFPRDHGSHPEFRTEWWYLTGQVRDAQRHEYGVQITFFRSRPGVAEGGTSRFQPEQLLFAHAAIAEARLGRLRHAQRAARAGFGLAQASEATTEVAIGDWTLSLVGDTYRATLKAPEFALNLTFAAGSLTVLLQGEEGVSRKGPRREQASFYYSRPQLGVTGTLTIDGTSRQVEGRAWLDHEWSSAYLADEARGWDWTGINFDDGSALMAFRIRDASGATYWAGGTLRDAAGTITRLGLGQVAWNVVREWKSPRTGTTYPVSMQLRAGPLALTLEPAFDDQELDSRASVGTIYWEGSVAALRDGQPIGHGYLELTGYGSRLRI